MRESLTIDSMRYHPTIKILVGGQDIPIAEFLQATAFYWLAS
jgi:hypothetical protein